MMAWIFERSKMVLVFLALLIIVGFITYFQLPKRELPEISPNVVTVKTVYPGASSEEVERNITKPLEDEIEGLDGLKDFSSISANGFSNIVLEFENDINRDAIYSKLQQRVSDVALMFPKQAYDPEVDTDLSPTAVASYHITSNDEESLLHLRDEMENWKDQVLTIPNVKSVIIKGLPKEEIVVKLDATSLKANGMSPRQVISAIQSEFTPTSIGSQKQNGTNYLLTLQTYKEVEEIEKVLIGRNKLNEPVYVHDVGTVNIEPKERVDIITYKGLPTISFTVLSTSGADIPSLQDEITSVIQPLSDSLTAPYKVEPFYIQSKLVESVFDDLLKSFLISIVAVVIIMLIGLPPFAAILVAVSIPLSILIGLIAVPYMGVDLNQISVVGVIIAIGILVDDAIVANENILRRYSLGDSPLRGAVNGIKEIRLSILTSSLMIIFSFFPLTFLSGASGNFIRALPTTLIFTIIGSTIIALTFVPIVTYWREKRNVKKGKEKKSFTGGLLNKGFKAMESVYADKLLKIILKRPVIISTSGILICLLLFSLSTKIPFEFFPPVDREEVTITVTYPNGTILENTARQLKEMEETIKKDETVKETAIFAGTGLPGLFASTISNPGENTGQLLVRVNSEISSTNDFIKEWENKLRKLYPEPVIMLDQIVSGPPVGAPVAIKISGPEMDGIADVAKTITDRLAVLDETKLVTKDVGTPQPLIQYELNRDVMEQFGVTTSMIRDQLQLTNQGIQLGTFDDGLKSRELSLVVSTSSEEDTIDLSKIDVRTSTQGGEITTVPLDQFVDENVTYQLQRIPRKNGERSITILAYPKDGEKDKFEDEAIKVVTEAKENLLPGYELTIGGETSERTDFFIEVTKLFVIVLFLIYLVIVVQFNSLSMPFLILSSVFLAVTGAILGLFVTNTPLSFLATLGIVSLSGVSVRNSVILIEFFEQRLKEGSNLATAIIDAGRARIRPIVLTSLTSIAALMPIALSGDVLFKPLAISIISGLIFSTALTLLLVPAFYVTLHKIRRKTKV